MKQQKTQGISKTTLFILVITFVILGNILSDWEHFKQGLLGI
ncbi:hypothetical protein DET49_12326 [Salegentibacter sp. 24]|nr:hypothetical protein DET49_12326 [Salegentibacter sp. 24]